MMSALALAAVAAAADVAGSLVVMRAHANGQAPLRYFVAGGAGFMLAAAFVRMLPASTHVPHAFLFVLIVYFGVHLFEHTVAARAGGRGDLGAVASAIGPLRHPFPALSRLRPARSRPPPAHPRFALESFVRL
jgi:hypothetical protein